MANERRIKATGREIEQRKNNILKRVAYFIDTSREELTKNVLHYSKKKWIWHKQCGHNWIEMNQMKKKKSWKNEIKEEKKQKKEDELLREWPGEEEKKYCPVEKIHKNDKFSMIINKAMMRTK